MTTAAPAMKKSDRTRATILEAARRQFAEAGYERTTIRSVAAAAGCDPKMVMRYFESKDGLFAAAAEFELRIPDFSDISHDEVGEALVRHFLKRWGDEVDNSLPVLLRTAASNEAAAERLRQVFRDQILAMAQRVRGTRPSSTAAAFVASQMLGLAYCLYILKLPALAGTTESEMVATVGETIQRYLDL